LLTKLEEIATGIIGFKGGKDMMNFTMDFNQDMIILAMNTQI